MPVLDWASAMQFHAEPPPLTEDEDGALRIGSSRVLLEMVIQAFQDDLEPEAIVREYSTLARADVYAVIAWYLRHEQQAEQYLAMRERQAQGVRQRVADRQGDRGNLRARLEAQRDTGASLT